MIYHFNLEKVEELTENKKILQKTIEDQIKKVKTKEIQILLHFDRITNIISNLIGSLITLFI